MYYELKYSVPSPIYLSSDENGISEVDYHQNLVVSKPNVGLPLSAMLHIGMPRLDPIERWTATRMDGESDDIEL